MAYDEALRSVSYDADASIAIWTGVPGQPGSASPNGGKQYHAVKITGDHTVGLADADDAVIGILQNKPQVLGAAATVAIAGVSRMVAAKAIDAGEAVFADANGQATDVDGTGTRIGTAVSPATAAGEILSVQLTI